MRGGIVMQLGELALSTSPFRAIITINSTQSFVLGVIISVFIIAWVVLVFKYQQLKAHSEILEISQTKYRKHFKDFLDTLPIGVIGAAPTGEILFKNYSIKEITGIDLQNLSHFDDLCCLNKQQREWILTQKKSRQMTQAFSTTLHCVNGSDKQVLLNVAAFNEEDPNLPAFYILMRDETKEKSMEVLLSQQDKFHQSGRLTTGIVHEIKNPLVSIKGYVEMLSRRLDDAEFVKLAFKVLPEEINRLQFILEGLLEYSKPASLKKSTFMMCELVENVVQLFKIELAIHRISLHINMDDQIIYADPGSIKQVLINIIMNAIDAMPSGGALNITSSIESDKWIMSLSDTGEGMEEDVLEKIFQNYFTNKKNGLGIGLPVSYQIMLENDGFIKINSRKGFGTTVSLEFYRSALKVQC